MNIARIDAATGVVVNVEVASLEWIAENADPAGPWIFVPYEDDNPAAIGGSWDPVGGFAVPAELITVTPAELEQLVDEKIVERQLEADVAVAESAGVKIDREPG